MEVGTEGWMEVGTEGGRDRREGTDGQREGGGRWKGVKEGEGNGGRNGRWEGGDGRVRGNDTGFISLLPILPNTCTCHQHLLDDKEQNNH